ncbi:unnamed protein product [Kuraishia capsulata CBS 1993]|uniref:Nuclear protein localization protein 4 n=1 Tax=Kuraishia capsulata CBS 1993 TaxID=1382522 RepID=W6MST5_9ASCO|nr:uncharacterized protein KUCA_T00005777001 [Kuraishia capsulata CBS 1993]CDK29784.1 unnamed protein product [Kuraishia capsulata CBS 1993]
MFRVETAASQDFAEVLQQLSSKIPDMDASSLSISDKPSDKGKSALTFVGQTVSQLSLKNGDLLFLSYSNKRSDETARDSASVALNGVATTKSTTQLPVDDLLDKQQGLIKRGRSTFCRHTEKGMCEYCSPLPPWDKAYQEENNIKHISYHAYVKEMNANVNKNDSSFIAPLEEETFKIDKHCPTGHSPWPKGICSKCQPSAITLQQQRFRMVDHVEFTNSETINNFINSWRLSGTQRFGVLLGTYDVYDKVPLGLKAKVEAIYEIPQIDDEDGITLQQWDNEEQVLDVAKRLGLVPVGTIFSDLTDTGAGDGSVVCKRHKDSFFLSSLEVIFAAKWQLKNPNVTKWSRSGKFSSKFVTCVVSGNSKGEIDIASYQISQAGEALVSADLISASTHPNACFINEQTDDRYVPEIFYKMVNEYGIPVKKSASPWFPDEYLIVSLTHGFPQDSSSARFRSEKQFTIENRGFLGTPQGLRQALELIDVDGGDLNTSKLRLQDFHLISYLLSLGVLSRAEEELLITATRPDEGTEEAFYELLGSPGWGTLVTMAE